MIKWVALRSAGPRPVPRPVATPLVWAAAGGTALLLVALVNALLGPGRPWLALTALALLATALGFCARFTAAPGTAALCWLFLNGFAIPPAGTLDWISHRDTIWLSCLLTATLVGTLTARVTHARAAYRTITSAPAPRSALTDGPYAP
ncbi:MULTISPECIES: hypothetical protein [unclassified Streptomyces]|uniref:hypothetical protein n=1 Tax=unclassified Streptomyces TaxID=2593676 RepID=UPI00278C15C1|nr:MULTISPECIES: hypothetical protein [unclassified Streptomyces]